MSPECRATQESAKVLEIFFHDRGSFNISHAVSWSKSSTRIHICSNIFDLRDSIFAKTRLKIIDFRENDGKSRPDTTAFATEVPAS